MSNLLKPRVLVTGASGQLGRRVVDLLLDAKTSHVVAASRSPEKLQTLVERDAEVRKADFDDPSNLDTAFAGIERLLIISTDGQGEPGLRIRQHASAVAAAVRAGVKHIVYTSMLYPEPGSLIPFAPDHYETEQAIEASGIDFTILRNNWYQENLLLLLPPALASGKWFTSAGNGRVSYVAREDVARTAAAVLTSDLSGRSWYDVTGTEAMNTAEIALIASDITGRLIEVVQLSDAKLFEVLSGAGVPAEFAQIIAAFDANTRAGKAGLVSDAVQRFIGRDPQSLGETLKAHRANLMATLLDKPNLSLVPAL